MIFRRGIALKPTNLSYARDDTSSNDVIVDERQTRALARGRRKPRGGPEMDELLLSIES